MFGWFWRWLDRYRGPKPQIPRFSFCERDSATSWGQWHIRRVTDEGLKFGGGIPTGSLCGDVKPHRGWDLSVQFTDHHLQHNTCERCARHYGMLPK